MVNELHPANNVSGVEPRDIDRFLSWIIRSPDTECWFWRGYRDSGGYGKFATSTGKSGGLSVPAHRFSYQVSVGPIPPGCQVHHKCNNRACVNPNHLEALSVPDHVKKTAGHPANQTHCIRGHEFTPENTRWYKGVRNCRACANLRQIWKYNPDHVVRGPSSNLYCVNNHPLFGENMDLITLQDGRTRRRCKQCRRDAAERHRVDNTQAILAAKDLRRADRQAAKKLANIEKIVSLGQTIHLIRPTTGISILRRLLNDCD